MHSHTFGVVLEGLCKRTTEAHSQSGVWGASGQWDGFCVETCVCLPACLLACNRVRVLVTALQALFMRGEISCSTSNERPSNFRLTALCLRFPAHLRLTPGQGQRLLKDELSWPSCPCRIRYCCNVSVLSPSGILNPNLLTNYKSWVIEICPQL